MNGIRSFVNTKQKKIILVLALLAVGLYGIIIQEGFTHWFPQGELRLANEKWKNGQYTESIKWFDVANKSAFDAGWRHIFVRYYYRSIPDLIDQGKYDEALDDCVAAVKMLNGHDDEGSLSFLCTQIEQAIENDK